MPSGSNISPPSPSSQERGTFAWQLGLALAVLAAIFWYFYFEFPYSIGAFAGKHPDPVPIANFLRAFWSSEQWQHCWLVLPAIAFVVYTQREELARLPLRGAWTGLVVLLGAFACYWVGYRVDNYYLGYLSIQLLVGGLVLWFCGWRWMRALSFCYGFLLFLWPLHFFESSITFPLRMIMAHASCATLNLIGFHAILNGTGILSAPDPSLGVPAGKLFSVDVADPCSGIRSLFALMMVSALYAHFSLRKGWQKWVLFLCSIPLAILGNLSRIVMLTLGTVAFGSEFAIGKDALTDPSWFHVTAGYVVFIVALLGMTGIAWLLSHGGSYFARWKSPTSGPRPPTAVIPRTSRSADPY